MASEYGSTTSRLFANASQATSYASLSASRITAGSKPNLSLPAFSYTVGDSNLGPAPVFSDVFSGVDNTNTNIAALNDQVDQWLAKYFPSINAGFSNVPEDYLIGVISGTKPFGVPTTVFDLVWQRARDRAYNTVASEQATLQNAFSARGFTLPAGTLVDAIAQTEFRASQGIMDVNREQAVKDAEIKADILKHAVGIATQLKTGILNTSADFFRAYYSVYGLGNDQARIRAQAYESYYQALATYYNVEVSWEELRLRAAEARGQLGVANDRNRVGLYGNDGAAQAHAAASAGFSQIAAQANAAAGTLVAQIESV